MRSPRARGAAMQRACIGRATVALSAPCMVCDARRIGGWTSPFSLGGAASVYACSRSVRVHERRSVAKDGGVRLSSRRTIHGAGAVASRRRAGFQAGVDGTEGWYKGVRVCVCVWGGGFTSHPAGYTASIKYFDVYSTAAPVHVHQTMRAHDLGGDLRHRWRCKWRSLRRPRQSSACCPSSTNSTSSCMRHNSCGHAS
eukprot:365734-Chlamydomonas_euryale.AAC.33